MSVFAFSFAKVDIIRFKDSPAFVFWIRQYNKDNKVYTASEFNMMRRGGAVVSTVASQQEGLGFESRPWMKQVQKMDGFPWAAL